MKDQMPNKDDDLLLILTKNIVHTIAGYTAEIAIASLTKVIQPLIVGTAPDKGMAIRMINKIARHLKEEIYKQPDSDFGFLAKSDDNNPIIHEGQMGVKKK